jgi:acyl carrier protein
MGLDTVELVMAVEDEFGVQIPECEAPKLAILGDMNDFILRALRQRGETPDEKLIWERLSRIVVKQLGVHPNEVTRSAHIVYDLRAD